MKTNILSLAFLCLLLLLAGCDDLLNLTPPSSATVAEFYQGPDDYKLAVNGIYASLRDGGQYGSSYWRMFETRSDNTFHGAVQETLRDIHNFAVSPTNGTIANFWEDTYDGIARANVLLARIQEESFEDGGLRERLEGEARFLRALMYFNLVRAYGDVPLVLNEITNVQESYTELRVDQSEIYAQIIEDLQDAEALLPHKSEYASQDVGRASKGAANALLGKVHLTLHDYQSAQAPLEEVINSGEYALWGDYASNFDPDMANGVESIFEVQFKKGGHGTGSNFMHQYAPRFSRAITGLGTGVGLNVPTEEMSEAYEENDPRKDVSMADEYEDTDGNLISPARYVRKYLDEPHSSGDNDNNWIVLRYADVLLMYGEVLNELGRTGEATDYLNQIRERVDLEPRQGGMSQQEFRLAVEDERRFELAFEGHRWADLIRTGRAIEVMNAKFGFTVQETDLVYPIPQNVIDTNPDIQQNPGY